MRCFGYFSVDFVSYFINTQLAIIYDGTHYPYVLEGESPMVAIIYLVVAVVGWAIVFAILLRFIYLYTFGLRKRLAYLVANGTQVRAKITKIVKSKATPGGHQRMEMIVKFNNFAGQAVLYMVTVVDTKPHLKRYEVDKQVALRVDKSLKHAPYVVIEGSEPKLRSSKLAIGLGGWVILLALLVWYFVFSYQTESHGFGWRFLEFNHPLIMSLILLLAVILIGYVVSYRSFILRMGNTKRKDPIKLLFFGDRATAFVSEASQTGVYINEQPVVKYAMHYTDAKGVRHETSMKKIVSLLNLHTVHESTKRIFYLSDLPQVTAFEEDLIPEN